MALNKIKEWQLDLSGINAKIDALGKPVNFKGRVDSVDQLPELGADGDLYYVGPIGSENKKEYIWYDGSFELVGSTSREDYDSLHNDLDELGDQVAEIESKIPESTSDTNPLINRQQLLDEEMDIREDMMESDSELQTQINALADAIQGGSGGGASSLYTKDNLLAGKNISFTEIPPAGGIDEHTLAVWHFDGTTTDEIKSVNFSLSLDATDSKFGTSCATLPYTSGSTSGKGVSGTGLTTDTDFTVDFWVKHPNTAGSTSFEVFSLPLSFNATSLWTATSGTSWANAVTINHDFTEWTHIALTRKLLGNIAEVFVNGKKVISQTVSLATGTELKYIYAGGPVSGAKIDEIRLSDNIRYTEDFTPYTEAYKVATGPSKTAINAIIPTQNSELENDSGFATVTFRDW